MPSLPQYDEAKTPGEEEMRMSDFSAVNVDAGFLRKQVEELTAERDRLKEANMAWAKDFQEMTTDRDAWKAKAEKIKLALEDASETIHGEFCGTHEHESCKRAKAALEGVGE